MDHFSRKLYRKFKGKNVLVSMYGSWFFMDSGFRFCQAVGSFDFSKERIVFQGNCTGNSKETMDRFRMYGFQIFIDNGFSVCQGCWIIRFSLD
jgi:hypothetical protein